MVSPPLLPLRMDLKVDFQVYSSKPLEVEVEILSLLRKPAIVLCIIVDSGVLALFVLSRMLSYGLMWFGFLYEPDVLLPIFVMKLLESHS
jgi:hypothetical protein